MSSYKIIISGGGTGGHLFPALSIANELKHRFPDADILFIGAENRMEMEHVPNAGYRVIGLPVSGFNRKNPLKNVRVLVRLLKSLRIAKKIIRDFKPDVAIGVGGYASGPTLWMASSFRIPVLIQEQNSFAGMTNKLLGKRASKICVAYQGMETCFPKDRIVITGNPVRKALETICEKSEEAFNFFGLEPGKPVLLVLGGSLGARTVNQSIRNGLTTLVDAGIQVIWQTGKINYDLGNDERNESRGRLRTMPREKEFFSRSEKIRDYEFGNGVWIAGFISRMDYAYSVADLVVSRAGAGTLSELCLLKKPVVLVPSPNVAEDHQTKNARALSDYGAAVYIPDSEAVDRLIPTSLELLKNKERLQELSDNIAGFAQYKSAERIVDEVVQLFINKEDEHP